MLLLVDSRLILTLFFDHVDWYPPAGRDTRHKLVYGCDSAEIKHEVEFLPRVSSHVQRSMPQDEQESMSW